MEQKGTAVIDTAVRNLKLLLTCDQPKISLSEEIKFSQGDARLGGLMWVQYSGYWFLNLFFTCAGSTSIVPLPSVFF